MDFRIKQEKARILIKQFALVFLLNVLGGFTQYTQGNQNKHRTQTGENI